LEWKQYHLTDKTDIMELNPEVFRILKENKIDKSEGTLCLLAIYYKLDADRVCSEEVIKAINTTKIVDRDYTNNSIQWNISLFTGQMTEWDWVKLWNNRWNVNMSRKAGNADVTKRMQEWFAKYPQYRKDDVQKATDMYFASQRDPQYLKNSAAFIFDGAGAMKKSILLSWCEKLGSTSNDSGSMQKGKVIS
jgi:hypothetical protein